MATRGNARDWRDARTQGEKNLDYLKKGFSTPHTLGQAKGAADSIASRIPPGLGCRRRFNREVAAM